MRGAFLKILAGTTLAVAMAQPANAAVSIAGGSTISVSGPNTLVTLDEGMERLHAIAEEARRIIAEYRSSRAAEEAEEAAEEEPPTSA